jgi:hypothetical protein
LGGCLLVELSNYKRFSFGLEPDPAQRLVMHELLESWMKDPKAKDRPDPLEAVVDIFPQQYINCFEGGREHVRLEQTQKICYVFFMVQ